MRMLFLAFALVLGGCAETGALSVVTETVDVGDQNLTFRYRPTGDSVPYYPMGATIVNADGIPTATPDGVAFHDVSYPTVRIGGTSDKFVALSAFYARCLPGQGFVEADFADEVFTFDERTAEFVFTYPCPPLAGTTPDA